MSPLRVYAVDDKHLRISGLDPLLARCLYRVPEILDQRDRPEIRARLFPDPLPGEAETNAEWHRLMDADLEHLFLSAGEIVARDLTGLQADQLTVPAEHHRAWMSALNQARLILGEQHGITESDLNRTDLDLHQARDRAVLEIHVLGLLLHRLVEVA